ncbi:MAG TPA: glycosyltransferase family 2 protein [Methylocystis sp.]|nr:glycosyltransferase family 2 protein [Methylocystis sp.]
MLDLGVVILCKDESRHLERLLPKLNEMGAKAFVVDSISTDGSVQLARSLGAHVAVHPFVSYAQQFDWALNSLPFDAQWVMRLDADEVLTPELVAEIQERLPLLPQDVTGVNLKRRHIFLGRWIRHGGRYPLTLLRIWRKGAAQIEQRWMDEHMTLRYGRAVTFEHDFADHNLNDLTFFTNKHNRYATNEAIDVLMARYDLGGASDATMTTTNTPLQAAAKRLMKEHMYNRMPLWVGPLFYFLYRYFLRFGFLDGVEGLVYNFLQGFWYRFLVAAKVLEFDRQLRTLPSSAERLRELARLTGKRVEQLAGRAQDFVRSATAAQAGQQA